MQLKRSKPVVERGRVPRQSDRPASPAFSYYNNRPQEPAARRSQDRQPTADNSPRRQLTLPAVGQLPFWILVFVGVVCTFKLLVLSTNPKVIVVGSTPTTRAYSQPTERYASAAHTVLVGSVTNYTKLTANVHGTATQLQRQFPELQTVSVTMPLMGNRPIVYALVAQPSLVLRTTHGDYAVNKSGVILAKITTLPTDVPLVTDDSGQTPTPGKQFLPSSLVNFIQTIAFQFTAANVPVVGYTLPAASPYELDAHLEGKQFALRFNTQENALQQSGTAMVTLPLMKAKAPNTYLDLRTPERVFYK